MGTINDSPAIRYGRPLRAPLLAAILAGACAGAPPADSSSRLNPDRLARLDAALEDYVASGALPGAVALVAGREEILYLKAFGYRDREADDPLETDDIFRIASQTKAIVSVAIMILQEDGRLLISDPVGRHLPEYLETTVATANPDGTYDVVPARQPITIRHLLTHTAGITYGGGTAAKEWIEADMTGWYFAHREEPIRETVRRMASLPFEAHPGDYWVYGYATDILGAVVEVASGLSLDEFLRTRIFEPLGMADTHFYLPPGKRDRLTVVYSAGEGGFTRAPDPGGMVGQGAYVDGPRTSFSGGAGLLSTASDYGRFLQMLLNGGRLGGARILSPKSVELMTVDHLGGLLVRDLNDASAVFGAERGVGFGLGFRVVEDVGAHGVPGSEGLYG
ncbi:MAG: beta-lactamase family protein, partial [Acidobacteria bacterium]|nr:beta-lactamase family protein [Acidobacteriota bacterium]